MKKDDISRACLENTAKLSDILADSGVPNVKKAWARVAMHESIAKAVARFHSLYPNWKEDVPRILSLNKKEQKAILRREKRKMDRMNKKRIMSLGGTKMKIGEKEEEGEEKEEEEEEEMSDSASTSEENEDISEPACNVISYKGNKFEVEIVSELEEPITDIDRISSVKKRHNNNEYNAEVPDNQDEPSENDDSFVQPKCKKVKNDSVREKVDNFEDSKLLKLLSSKTIKKIEEKPLSEEKHVDPFFVTRDNKEYLSYTPAVLGEETNQKQDFGSKDDFRNQKFGRNKFEGRFDKYQKGGFERLNGKRNDFHKRNRFNEGKPNDFPKSYRFNKEKLNDFPKIDRFNKEKPNKEYEHNNFANNANRKTNFSVKDTPEEILHPSWQAKKKLSTIPTFEGKKITFGD